jgi:hypothetical protein
VYRPLDQASFALRTGRIGPDGDGRPSSLTGANRTSVNRGEPLEHDWGTGVSVEPQLSGLTERWGAAMNLIMKAEQCAASTSSSWREGGPSGVRAHPQRQRSGVAAVEGVCGSTGPVLCLVGIAV